MKAKIFILRFVSLALLILGIIRIFANQSTFEYFRNGDLWPNEILLQYLFKATGGFILFHAIMFFGISRDMVRYRSLFGPYALALFVSGTAMLIVGYLNFLPIWLYGSDALICYLLAIFCFYVRD